MSRFARYFPDGVQPGMFVPWAHKGAWSIADLLPYLFSDIGAFHLSLATFNISEDALRPIFMMRERNEFLSTRFLFDTNIKRHKLDMMLFSANIADEVRTASTHQKVIICTTDEVQFCSVGSANMNRAIRHEAGFFSTQPEVVGYYLDYYNEIYENEAIPFII